MALLPANVDYSDRDFNALRLRLQGLIRSVHPNWTEFNVANYGNLLLEGFCYVGDVTNFYQDRNAGDLYWPVVRQRANAIRLGRGINFDLTSAVSATTTCTFTLPANAPVAVPIPYGTRLRTPGQNPQYFRVIDSAAEIAVGTASVTGVNVEQATAVGTRDPVSGELLPGETFTSTGAPNQRYLTIQGPTIDDSITVTIEGTNNTISASADIQASNGKYYQVDSFLDDDPVTGLAINQESRVFVAKVHPTNRLEIVFGNGSSGKIPEGDVGVAYKLGGGVAGNVEANQIIVLEQEIVDANGRAVTLTVTNPTAATGGVDEMTIPQARVQGPRSLRVLERSVTKEDFEIVALGLSGVARAVMITSNEDATIPENSGTVYVVAKGERYDSGRIAPGVPSATLLADVLTAVTVTNPQTLTFDVSTAAAVFKTINVNTRVYIASGYEAADVGSDIRDAVKDFFAAQLVDGTANPDIDFGANIKQADGTVISEIAWSDVFNAVRDAEGVRKVDEGTNGLLLNSARQSVTILPREFPVIGTITIVDADTEAGL
jgi:hypothetical protein